MGANVGNWQPVFRAVEECVSWLIKNGLDRAPAASVFEAKEAVYEEHENVEQTLFWCMLPFY
jgi:hypothetical protein